ncbi:aminotransferase class IV [Massilia sp. B-10]|nr:aminotransferase class IV [Massilia sp. B-10]
MDHSVWLGSSVFDGARAIAGQMPDLDLHLQRVIHSAERLGLQCPLSVAEMGALVREGVAKFPANAELYIRPLVFGCEGFLIPEAEHSGFALTLFDAPMPPFTGFSACLSRLRRPDASMAPTDAKASALYANSTRVMRKRRSAATTMASCSTATARWPNSPPRTCSWSRRKARSSRPCRTAPSWLSITRARVIALLAEAGVAVEERTVQPEELLTAAEIFNTGNYGKVTPCVLHEERTLPVGPMATLARDRYLAYMAQA